MPTGKRELTRGADYAANANVFVLLAFIFNGSFVRRADQPPLAYPVSTPLSKPLHPHADALSIIYHSSKEFKPLK